MMTPETRTIPSLAEHMKLFRENRSQFPSEQLRQHAGQWVAFSIDGCRILAAAQEYAEVERQLAERGHDPQEAVFEHVFADDIYLGGAELL